jgi:hypothetical protein
MKTRSYLALCALLVTFGSSLRAQYYIEQNDMLIIGTTIIVYHDTLPPSLDFASGGGSGMTWDFSGIGSDGYYSHEIIPPAGQVRSNKFPSATTAVIMTDDKQNEISTSYYNNGPSNARFLASIFTIIDSSIFRYNYIQIKYPAQLSDTHRDTGDLNRMNVIALGFDPDGPGTHPFVDSMALYRNEYTYYIIDGFGTVKTPAGDFDAYRQYNEFIFLDSMKMYANGSWQLISPTLSSLLSMSPVTMDTLWSYTWLTKGKSWPVATIEFDANDNNKILTAQWADVSPSSVEGIELSESILAFPNPSSNVLTISELPAMAFLHLFSINGEEVLIVKLDKGTSNIDVSALKPGTYLLKIMDMNGKLLTSKKVVVD